MPQNYHKYTDPKLDGRVKILPEQHEEVRRAYRKIKSQRKVAKLYGVSRRLIQWILEPEKLKQFQADRIARKAHLDYYKREVHTKAIKKYRDKKRSLNLQYNPNKITL